LRAEAKSIFIQGLFFQLFLHSLLNTIN